MQRKILIASHGKLAEGMLDTLSLFFQNNGNITMMCGYTQEGNKIEEEIERYMKMVQDEEVIIFTDMMGGSVNSLFLPYLGKKNIHLIAGFNLPLILEFVCLPEEKLEKEKIHEVIEKTRMSMLYVNDCAVSFSEDDE